MEEPFKLEAMTVALKSPVALGVPVTRPSLSMVSPVGRLVAVNEVGPSLASTA